EIARMRALETGRFLLRATNTGISAIIDERGRLRASSPQFEQAILSGDVVPMRGSTPFVFWGNLAILVLVGLMLVFGAWQRQRVVA
ncbi:MAG: apolipoprotein N-acyltransferase, partial [Gammaproteobacteria bacterium]|nr:apolipoprotein N-acyltransferase [Gammaproteobacteria bacterium]